MPNIYYRYFSKRKYSVFHFIYICTNRLYKRKFNLCKWQWQNQIWEIKVYKQDFEDTSNQWIIDAHINVKCVFAVKLGSFNKNRHHLITKRYLQDYFGFRFLHKQYMPCIYYRDETDHFFVAFILFSKVSSIPSSLWIHKHTKSSQLNLFCNKMRQSNDFSYLILYQESYISKLLIIQLGISFKKLLKLFIF